MRVISAASPRHFINCNLTLEGSFASGTVENFTSGFLCSLAGEGVLEGTSSSVTTPGGSSITLSLI